MRSMSELSQSGHPIPFQTSGDEDLLVWFFPLLRLEVVVAGNHLQSLLLKQKLLELTAQKSLLVDQPGNEQRNNKNTATGTSALD